MPDTTPTRPAMTMREIRDRLGHTQPDTTPADRRTLTADQYSSAWHAVEGSTGESGADPATVLAAVLRVLDINPPARLVLGTTDQQPDTIGLCADCGVPRETHHHGYVRTLHLADEAQQPETEALCGKTVGVSGLYYRPCARPAGHPEGYCRDATGDHLFLAAADQPDTETEAAK